MVPALASFFQKQWYVFELLSVPLIIFLINILSLICKSIIQVILNFTVNLHSNAVHLSVVNYHCFTIWKHIIEINLKKNPEQLLWPLLTSVQKISFYQILPQSHENCVNPFVFLNMLFRKICEFQGNVVWALCKFSNSQNRADILILAWQITWNLLWM